MKRELNIGTRLTLGFGVIIALVIVLGAFSFHQSSELWNLVDDMFRHPYQTGRTVRDIQIQILEIHLKAEKVNTDKTLSLSKISYLRSEIEDLDINLRKSIEDLYKSYLGPTSEIDTLVGKIRRWKYQRDHFTELRLDSDLSGSDNVDNNTASYNIQELMNECQKLILFSNGKGIQFYEAAVSERNRIVVGLVLVIFTILVVSVFIVHNQIKQIRVPLKDLVFSAERYGMGDFGYRSGFTSKNEMGILVSSFNNMAESIQNESVIKENALNVSKLLLAEDDLRTFSKSLLQILMERTDSQVAAIYFLDDSGKQFENYESIGLSADNIRSFSAHSYEGEFGQVLSTKKTVRITEIPRESIFSFPVVAGVFRPAEIITIPVIYNNEVISLISLASLKPYSRNSLKLLEALYYTINARVSGVLSSDNVKKYITILDVQNRELEQKSKELGLQTDELKEYNIELEQQKKVLDDSNRHKSIFLSNMSHELRTPLNSIIVLSGVLSKRLAGMIPNEEYHYLDIIERNGKNLLALINDILDISRIESGKEEFSISGFSALEVVSEILVSFEPLILEKGLAANCNISQDLPDIFTDKAKFSHIMQNIIGNAIKFTDKGLIEISAYISDTDIHVSVRDTGIGISEEHIPLIFEEFRQLDDKSSRRHGGTGLGLAIVRKYCHLLDGRVEVKSRKDEGSVFTIILPLKNRRYDDVIENLDNNMHYFPKHEAGKAGIMSVKGKNLLLVDDCEAQIVQMTDILKEEGYIIRIARNGREALEEIKLKIPDAMILDLQMPDVNGFEVLKEVRSLKETSRIPVLILTAKNITRSELSFLKGNNIHQLIQKGSIKKQQLIESVKNLTSYDGNEHAAPLMKKSQASSRKGRKSILIIEDNPDNLITVEALLENRCDVITAATGSCGVSMALDYVPDLILLDISLPEMDGFKVLDELRLNSSTADIPVIALTARAMKGDRESLLAYGFNSYISKPVEKELFDKVMEEYLGSES